jgi:hypothetical protein
MEPSMIKVSVHDFSQFLQKVLIDYGIDKEQIEPLKYEALFTADDEQHAAFRIREVGATEMYVYVFPGA